MNVKKILITNFEIKQFSGSEINVISIAECFQKKGYEIYIASLDFGKPLYDEIKSKGYHFINILKDNYDFNSLNFEIVWSQHPFLLEWLIFEKRINTKKVIISSLSPFEAFESLPEFAKDMNLIIANSLETKKQLEKEGFKNIQLFENSAYKNFFENPKNVKELKSIAIISNHVPQEVIEAKKILENKKYVVDIYGLAGKKVLINEDVLKKYDLVISIGKTVQFCMALKIPIYVYDRFGGPGYISNKNIDLCREYNFSGRMFEKKSPIDLVNDILQNFENSLQNLDYLYNYALNFFCFEDNFEKILNMVLNDKKIVDLEVIYLKCSNKRYNQIFPKFYRYSFNNGYEEGKQEILKKITKELELYKNDNVILKNELKKVEKENLNYIKKINELNLRLEQIYNSRIWRYTKIFRKNK